MAMTVIYRPALESEKGVWAGEANKKGKVREGEVCVCVFVYEDYKAHAMFEPGDDMMTMMRRCPDLLEYFRASKDNALCDKAIGRWTGMNRRSQLSLIKVSYHL
jgi:hypothetical protein